MYIFNLEYGKEIDTQTTTTVRRILLELRAGEDLHG